LKNAALAAAATGLPAWFVEENRAGAQNASTPSANDKPNAALIGCGGQGRGDTQSASRFANIVAVCDVDELHARSASRQFNDAKVYNDFHKLLERDDIHVIMNGTPDHWHTLVNLAAVKAGKDIYGEKPLTLTIDEGRHLVAAVEKAGRIFQVGSQQRSDARFRLACELVRNQRIGKLTHVVTALPAGPRSGPFRAEPVPPELNWDYWLGQTPKVDYVPQRCHGTFRYWYEYSGGTMTDWGAHHNDIALWAMGLDHSGPVTVEGRQLVDMIPGGFTAPAEYHVTYTYRNGVTHECISVGDRPDGSPGSRPGAATRPTSRPRAADVGPGHITNNGVLFEGTDGWIWVTRGTIRASDPDLLKQPLGGSAQRLYVSNDHMRNFFDCVKSRKPTICPPMAGHRAATVCHLGVISMRLGGRKLHWDPDREQFINDAEAQAFVTRHQREPYTYASI
jgi:predicted dehydrogenase